MKKQISLLLAALLLLTLLVGCGGSGSAKPAATGYAYDTDASTAPEAPMEQDSKFIIRKHLLDSLTLLPYFKLYGSEVGCRTLDVGCGGGLPAIPLSIFLKDFDFNLIDTVNKKITFVRQAVIQLKLPNVNAFNERVENFHPLKPFNLISCRAFSSLASFVTLTEHLIDENGRWLAMKGKYPVEEINELPAGVGVEKVIELKVPFLDTERHLIVLKKK